MNFLCRCEYNKINSKAEVFRVIFLAQLCRLATLTHTHSNTLTHTLGTADEAIDVAT